MSKSKSGRDIRTDAKRWARGGRGDGGAAKLAGRAGLPAEAGHFDELEKRELLFALSLDQNYSLPLSTGVGPLGLQNTFLNDPASLLRGSVYSRFGYVLPFFQRQVPASTLRNATTETFGSLPEGQMAPLELASTARFSGTGLTIEGFNVDKEDLASTERYTSVVTFPPNPSPTDTNPTSELLLHLTGSNQVRFSVTDEADPTRRFLKSLSFTVNLRANTDPVPPGSPPGQFTSGPTGRLVPSPPDVRAAIQPFPPTNALGGNPTTIPIYDLDTSNLGTKITLFKGTRAIETFFGVGTVDDPTTLVVESPISVPRTPNFGQNKPPLSPFAQGPTYSVQASDGKSVFDSVLFERINPVGGQRLVLTGAPTGGTFTLSSTTVDDIPPIVYTTGNLAFNATAAQVQSALEALPTIGVGNVTVAGANGGPWQIAYSANAIAKIDGFSSALTGGAAPTVVFIPDVDQILLSDMSPELQTGRFATMVGDRVFGAQVGLAGSFGGTLDVNRNVFVSAEEALTTATPGPLTFGQVFPTSRLRIDQTATVPASAATIVAGGAGAGNQLTFMNQEGKSLVFSFRDERGNARPLRNFTFSSPVIGTAGAITPGLDIIQLFREGKLVRSYSPADIAPTVGDPSGVAQVQAGGARTRYYLDTVRFGAQDLASMESFRNGAFDEVRISRTLGSGAAGVAVDEFSGYFPPMVEFFDLYGRPTVETLGLKVASGRSAAPLVDQNDDGIPDFNDGIGRIVISNSREDTNFTIAGGTITFDSDLNGVSTVRPGGFLFKSAAQLATGLFTEFQTASFGHFVQPPTNAQDTTPIVYGLPTTGGGSVVIGSPFARDNRSTLAYLGYALDFNLALPARSSFAATRGGNPGAILDVGANIYPTSSVFVTPGSVDTRQELQFSRTYIENTLFDTSGAPILANVTLGTSPQFQGVFVAQGQNVGAVLIDGAVYGNSVFGGAVRSLTIGYLPGSVTVNGDIKSLSVRSNAGVWVDTFAAQTTSSTPVPLGSGNGPVYYTTNSQVTIGRSAGELLMGNLTLSNVLVQNDLTNPLYSALDFTAYAEREVIQGSTSLDAIFGQGNQLDDGVKQFALLFGALFDPMNDTFRFGGTGSTTQLSTRFPFTINRVSFINSRTSSVAVGVTNPENTPDLTAAGTYRNDTILGGEFIGSPTGAVRLSGVLGGFGPQSSTEDTVDVFGFAGSVGSRVDFAIVYAGVFAGFFAGKVVDSRGRTLANYQNGVVTGQRTPDSQTQPDIIQQAVLSARFSFTPDATDAYYLVLSRPASGSSAGFMSYEATITGLPNLSLGMLSFIGGLPPNAITVAGSVGLIRFAAGVNNIEGTLTVPQRTVGNESDNDYLTTRKLQLTVNGSVAGLLFGGAVDRSAPEELSSIQISGDLGVLRTGVNPLAGVGPTFGDFAAGIISVGGSIGEIDINGALGANLNPFPDPVIITAPVGPVEIRAGVAGGRGDIGAVLVGTYVAADRVRIRTAQGGTLDRFIVGTQGPGSNPLAGSIRLNQPSLLFAAGTNIRFADFTQVSTGSSGFPVDESNILPLTFGQTQTFTDVSGVVVDVSIGGGGGRANSGGQIIALPVAGAGLLIGSIQVGLGTGAELRIGSRGGSTVGLGRILINSTGTRGGSLIVSGNTAVDVLRVDATGTPLDRLENRSIGGDLVSADVSGVRSISINGDLGSTNTTQGMRTKIGHFLGLVQGDSVAVGGTIGVPGLVNNWDGATYETVAGTTATVPASGDQVGLPYDPFLNGVLVRGGNVDIVSSGGKVGDVLLTGPAAILRSVVANSRRLAVQGVFNGIVGSIYATTITAVDIGDGLAGPGQSGLAEAGIFANGAIINVYGAASIRNPIISGVIIAAGLGGVTGRNQPGINAITLYGGRIDGAFIGGASLDSFWRAPRATVVDAANILDNPTATATVVSVVGYGTTMFRSTVFGTNIGTVNLVNGIYDASSVVARGTTVAAPGGVGTTVGSRGTISQVVAAEFRNSTIGGESGEFFANQIIASDQVQVISAARDISDLEITTPTNLISLQLRSADRLTVNVGNITNTIQLRGDLRSSTLNVGRLDYLTVSGGVRATAVSATGPVGTVTVYGDVTNTAIKAIGAGARISTVNVIGDLSGDISSTGPIASISAGRNLAGTVTVFSTSDGMLNSIRAGGDLAVSINVPGNVNSIYAGGMIGRRVARGATVRDVIDINGNLGTVTALGQIYADIRVGQAITGIVSAGRTSALAGADFVSDFVISAARRINGVSITGDFRGSVLSQSGGIGSVTVNAGSLIGSARAANAVDARDGDIGFVSVTRGHILGSISARDGSINSINVTADAAGFGNLGVDRDLSSAVTAGIPAAEQRGQLPVGFDNPALRYRPTIFAGRDIGSITVGRSVFEASIQAGRRINSVSVVGNIDGGANPLAANISFIVAGDEIGSVSATGTRAAGTASARGTIVAAGILSLGADNLPGGAGANADLVKSGIVGSVAFRNDAIGTAVYAGLEAGPNGVFDQGGVDDTVAPGLSTINSVVISRPTLAGVSAGNFAFAKTRIASVSAPAGSLTATQASASTNAAITGLTTAAPRVTGNLEFVGDPVALGYTLIPAAGLPVPTNDGFGGLTAVTIRYSGAANQAYYDALNSRVVIVGTTAGNLTIDGAANSTIAGPFAIQTARNVSLNSIVVRPQVVGGGGIYVDGNLASATFNLVNTSSPANPPGSVTNVFLVGGAVGAVTIGATDTVATGVRPNILRLAASTITSVTFLNGYGVSSNSRIDARTLGSFTVTGTFNGVVSSDMDINAVRVNGAFNGRVRSGGSIASFAATTATNARLSARGNLPSVSLTGAADGLAVYAGVDLGGDGDFDPPTGAVGSTILGTPNADTITNGNIGSVTVGGAFTRSDIAAGRSRGVENFLNRAGDLVAGGRSDIGSVRIAGSVGSIQQTQSYGIFASGTLGPTNVGNVNLTGSLGNFARKAGGESIKPLQVVTVTVDNSAVFTYTAQIVFNQNINPGLNNATLLGALNVAELRDGGQGTPIVLRGAPDFSANNDVDPSNDVDYAVAYNPANFTATLTFARTLTDRALLSAGVIGAGSPGARSATLAGPGVYKVTLAPTLTGATVDSRLDGNGDGLAAPGETFARNVQIGDVGDRAANFVDSTTSLYGPTDLNLLLNSDRPGNNGSPDVNTPYTIRGRIGDSPSLAARAFSPTSDIDVFAVSLRAGQILRFGELGGTAQLATRAIYDSTFVVVPTSPATVLSVPLVSSSGYTIDTNRPIVGLPQRYFGDVSATKLQRMIDPSDNRNANESFLVRQTGVYYIAVGSSITQLATPAANLPPSATNFSGLLNVGVFQPTAVEIGSSQGNQGDYNFSVTIEDSGASGFFGTPTPAASAPGANVAGSIFSGGAAVVPTAANFRIGAGLDGIVGTSDDVLAPFIERLETGAAFSGFSLTDADGFTQAQSNKWVFQLVPTAAGLFGLQPDGSIAGNVRGTNNRGIVAVRDPAINAGVPTVVRTVSAGSLPTTGGAVAAPAVGAYVVSPSDPRASVPITVSSAVQTSGGVSAGAVPGVAPAPSAFQFQRYAGADNVFGNGDDYIVGSDAFDRVAGPDGLIGPTVGPDMMQGTADDGPSDDSLSPTARVGTTVRRTAGPDGVLGTADDVQRFSVDSGDGALLSTAPLPTQFFPVALGLPVTPAAGTILAPIVRGEWTFTLQPGGANKTYQGDGVGVGATTTVRTADRVIGENSRGVRYIFTAGADGRFGTLDDATTIESSVGRRGLNGVNTASITPDLDVYHLENGGQVAAGTRYRITLKANQTGANLGLLAPQRDQQGIFTALRLFDTRGAVQIGLFDTTFNNEFSTGVAPANGADFGTNLFNSALDGSTSGFGGYSGARSSTVTNGITGYGTDANGDAYVDVLAPAALNPVTGAASTNGTFAVYVQGVTRSDYTVEIVKQRAATVATAVTPLNQRTQNFLIETGGGQVTWLEANPYTPTTLDVFDPGTNALVGNINGVSAATYIINSPAAANPAGGVVQRLRALFNGTNAPGFTTNVADGNGSFGTTGTVRFSTNAADFEGQPYSTVYITSSPEPVSMTTSQLSTLVFGASQRVDTFNANPRDEAVIFTRAFNVLTNGAGTSGANLLINEITAAAARRVGELLGARLVDQTSLDVLSSQSVLNASLGVNGTFLAPPSRLSPQGITTTTAADLVRSTDFFLGDQRSLGLLNRIFRTATVP